MQASWDLLAHLINAKESKGGLGEGLSLLQNNQNMLSEKCRELQCSAKHQCCSQARCATGAGFAVS